MEKLRRILLVTFPAQGHINPSLQFAKRLARMEVEVTFVTAFSAINRMSKSTTYPQGLKVVGFSDGYDDGFKDDLDIEQFMADLRRRGSEAVAHLITSEAEKSQPFDHVVYTTLLPWVSQVARTLHVPSTFLWIQPAAMLDIYYYYFNGYGDVLRKLSGSDSSCAVEMPGLPPLRGPDLPSFFQATNCYNFAIPLFKEHLEILESENYPKVLVNTFDALEPDALRAVEKLNMVGIGPLIPSAFLDGKDPSDTSFGGDLFQKSSDYIQWLNSKPQGSVIYVAFGSYSVISKQQMEEIAIGLLESHKPFLWVIRGRSETKKDEEKLRFEEELEKQGLIVPWCSQVEVLSHPSVGCFVTHCGWNSTFESLVSGVPVVAFPQWTDQTTNAKLIEEVWKTGVRVVKNKEGIVEGGMIKKGIHMVMEEGRGEEMRTNAKKWKKLAREAAQEGGSSDLNLRTFLHQIKPFN